MPRCLRSSCFWWSWLTLNFLRLKRLMIRLRNDDGGGDGRDARWQSLAPRRNPAKQTGDSHKPSALPWNCPNPNPSPKPDRLNWPDCCRKKVGLRSLINLCSRFAERSPKRFGHRQECRIARRCQSQENHCRSGQNPWGWRADRVRHWWRTKRWRCCSYFVWWLWFDASGTTARFLIVQTARNFSRIWRFFLEQHPGPRRGGCRHAGRT